MIGYSREELLSIPISAVHPEEMPLLQAFAQSVFDKGRGWTNELTCLTKSGQKLPAEISASPIAVFGGKQIIAMVRDITERKKGGGGAGFVDGCPQVLPPPGPHSFSQAPGEIPGQAELTAGYRRHYNRPMARPRKACPTAC